MNTDIRQFDLLQRPVLFIYWRLLHYIECRINTINYPANGRKWVGGGKEFTYTCFPRIVYFPSRWLCLEYVTKNWLLFVSGPELAIATTPRELNFKNTSKSVDRRDITMALTFNVERTSSAKGLPQMDWPPLPVPVGSPPCIIKPLMFLWNNMSEAHNHDSDGHSYLWNTVLSYVLLAHSARKFCNNMSRWLSKTDTTGSLLQLWAQLHKISRSNTTDIQWGVRPGECEPQTLISPWEVWRVTDWQIYFRNPALRFFVWKPYHIMESNIT